MNNHGLKAYDKYSVKYDRSARQIKNEDGTPVLDELVSSNVTLTPEDAKFLNAQWSQFCYYYVPSSEKKTVEKKESESIINAESLKKDITLDKLNDLTEEEIDAVFAIMSKAAILDVVGIEIPKNKINLIKTSEVIAQAKAKLNEIKNK